MKTDQEIYESSMAEDDPKIACSTEQNLTDPPQRWGRNHKGAKILANFYSRGNNTHSCHTFNYNSSAIINLSKFFFIRTRNVLFI